MRPALTWLPRLACTLALLAPSACSGWQAQAEAALAQDLSVFCPRPGSTTYLGFTEADGDRVLMRFQEQSREAIPGGWRLKVRQSFLLEQATAEASRPESYTFVYARDRLEMQRDGSSEIQLVAQAPLRLGAPAAPGPHAARLSAIAPLDLPYGRIPWAAALQQSEGDRVATSWFAPGLGLVRFDEARPGQAPQSAKLKLLQLP